MPVLLPNDTAQCFGLDQCQDVNTENFVKTLAKKCDNYSLLFDRYANPAWHDGHNNTPRRTFFEQVCENKPLTTKTILWEKFIGQALRTQWDDIIFATTNARMMLNMGGGVMENAGICLDRNFGIPYIPGSAIKGCARHAAIIALRDWHAGKQKPVGVDNLLAPICDRLNTPNELLLEIVLTFGWVEQDWQDKGAGSDLKWACSSAETVWEESREHVAKRLFDQFGWRTPKKNESDFWRHLPNFAGSAAFLPAYPWDLPTPHMETDVITCHHPKYYEGKDNAYGTAPDIESPVPVVFPALAAGITFAFAIRPSRDCKPGTLEFARTCLKVGLQAFGIGAKTAAGYGWFDAGEHIQQAFQQKIAEEQKRRQQAEEEAKKREKDERQRQAEEAAAQAKRKKEAADREKLQGMTLGQLQKHLSAPDKFTKLSNGDKLKIITVLRDVLPDLWRQIKEGVDSKKQTERRRCNLIVAEINRLIKAHKLEKMP